MESAVRILIVARPGHFRDSMVAVLKTLPRVELFLANGLSRGDWDGLSQAQPAIVLADLDATDPSEFARMELLKEIWPGIRCIALVDNYQQARAARTGKADQILARGASAGELLAAIQRLSAGSLAAPRLAPVYPVSTMP